MMATGNASFPAEGARPIYLGVVGMSARRLFFAFLAVVLTLGLGLPAVADEIVTDSAVLVAGGQPSVVNLTATPGQVQAVPVDLFISCKTQKHIGGTVVVSLAAAGGNGSVIPAGGTLSAAAV